MKSRFKKYFILIIKTAIIIGIMLTAVFGLMAPFWGFDYMIRQIVYLSLFLLWIALIVVLKQKSTLTLKVSFYLFLLSALLYIVGFKSIGEVIIRYSYVGWIVGFGQRFIVNVKDGKKANSK